MASSPDSPVAAPDHARADIELLREAAEGWPTPNPYTEACDRLLALLAERQQDKERIEESLGLVALALAIYGDTNSKAAETIPQRVWDDLHERGLVRTGQDFTGDARTEGTAAGLAHLIDALARAALAVEEDATP